jgi:hypothetical protein
MDYLWQWDDGYPYSLDNLEQALARPTTGFMFDFREHI